MSKPTDYPTYYNQPAIRGGHWRWLVIAYFWAGGIAGGSYLLAALAHLVGAEEDRAVARWGRYLAFGFGAILSPILLILDLGRPERFLHMLRIFKLRSAMSVGAWGLSAFGSFAAMSTFLQAARDGLLGGLGPLARLGRWLPFAPFEAIGTSFGLFMSGYTGVLISNTVVPLWARLRKTNGPVFLSSALATASAAISLMLALTDQGTRGSQRRLARVQAGSTLMEGALLAHELHHLGPLRRFLLRGEAAPFFYLSVATGIVAPLLMGSPHARPRQIVKALLTLSGGFLFRSAIILGGQASARDPQAYFWFAEQEQP